mmetsp:Transcript_121444/g.271413  ORF Transcript_121444/g.271413 Transcript_121444/m.271413 type:complete len:258 (-) Transcript_121444:160-933(-)
MAQRGAGARGARRLVAPAVAAAIAAAVAAALATAITTVSTAIVTTVTAALVTTVAAALVAMIATAVLAPLAALTVATPATAVLRLFAPAASVTAVPTIAAFTPATAILPFRRVPGDLVPLLLTTGLGLLTLLGSNDPLRGHIQEFRQEGHDVGAAEAVRCGTRRWQLPHQPLCAFEVPHVASHELENLMQIRPLLTCDCIHRLKSGRNAVAVGCLRGEMLPDAVLCANLPARHRTLVTGRNLEALAAGRLLPLAPAP